MPWTLDGDDVLVKRDKIELSPRELTLTISVPRDALARWRSLDSAGGVRVEDGYGGNFKTVGRGASTATATPPLADSPPFDEIDGFVVGYSEEQISPDRADIEIRLHRRSPREDQATTVTESPTGDEVSVELNESTLALADQDVGQTDSDGTTAEREHDIALRLTDGQAGAFLDEAARPAGVTERAVDGDRDQVVDESGGGQTMTLILPSDSVLPTGRYLIRGWTLSQVGQAPREIVDDGETETVASGETRTISEDELILRRGGTLSVERGGALPISRGSVATPWLAELTAALDASLFIVRDGETETVASGETRTVTEDEATIRRGGTLSVERGGTVTKPR